MEFKKPAIPKALLSKEPERGNRCLNCGFETTAKFCSECGQENEVLKMGLKDILKDALEEFIRFDSKFFETIWPLFFKPGFLTREWVLGRRTRYITPFKLYLTATFLFFFVAGLINPSVSVRDLPEQNKSAKGLKVNSDSIDEDSGFKKIPWAIPTIKRLRNLERLDSSQIGPAIIERVPQALFFALPILALMINAIYIRSGRLYVEHLVFVLHNHAFYFFTLTLSEVFRSEAALNIAVMICIVYSVLALKNYYGQKWMKTTTKGCLLGCGYIMLVGFVAAIALFMVAFSLPEAKKPSSIPATSTKQESSPAKPRTTTSPSKGTGQ